MKIPLEVPSLDGLLQGGFEPDALTLIYGEAGSGKTNICLQISRNVARKGHKAIYMDTEGVSLERLRQMSGDDFEKVLNNILFFKPFSFEDQEKMLDEAIRMAEESKDIKVVILDSATVYYRLKYAKSDQGRSSLSYQIVRLLTLARRSKKVVIVTSQVYFEIEGQKLRALGGHALYHNAKTIIHLERIDERTRRAIIMKHRYINEGKSAVFLLSGKGVE